MNLLISTRCISPSTGEDHPGIPQKTFTAKSRNGSTSIRISQRMASGALPETEPVGDDLQSTAHWSTDDGQS